MPLQNIYDNEVFFDGYSRLRQRAGNANTLFEIPALMSLLSSMPFIRANSIRPRRLPASKPYWKARILRRRMTSLNLMRKPE